ncbi:uncharacterized protein LOC115442952 [Manduca sexta]|uniref:uncharacterized protein LOC115442952 n=1 Tax=Manduca sexta TaxID=7130 RepID=UPI00188E6F91|nr:uncharacterized protein LOC115442952 [Manduca sexta]XP_037296113.1 uncharacterized protein LOC115442952 [Manduca sexta]
MQSETNPEIPDLPNTGTACEPQELEQHVSPDSESVSIEVPVAPECSLVEGSGDSEIESYFDTPEESQLRKQLKRRKKIILRNNEQIKAMKKRLRELNKQQNFLQDKIDKIKDKESKEPKQVLNEEASTAGPSGTLQEPENSPSSLEVSDNSEVEIFDSPVETKLRHKLKRVNKLYDGTLRTKKQLSTKIARRPKQIAVLEKKLEDLKKMKCR